MEIYFWQRWTIVEKVWRREKESEKLRNRRGKSNRSPVDAWSDGIGWSVSRFRSLANSFALNNVSEERNNVIDFQRGNVPAEAGTEEESGSLGLCPTAHPRLVDESKFVIDVWTGAAMPASHNSSTSFPISTTGLARFPCQTQRVTNSLSPPSLDSFIFLHPLPSRRHYLRFPILWKDLFDFSYLFNARSFENNFSSRNRWQIMVN